jgi:hypothetical protein
MQFNHFYLNAHTQNDQKKVIVYITVNHEDILIHENIENRENAEYQTKRINKVNSIFDKNGNFYNTAINIYSDDNYIFNIGQRIISNTPINIYINYNTCISKLLLNKVKKINIYNKNGATLMTGLIKNGIFTGISYGNNSEEYHYTDGVLINKSNAII